MRPRLLLDQLLDFCYPGVCAHCQAGCPGQCPLCDSCLRELAQLEQMAACGLCAMPLAAAGSPCPYCQGEGLRPFEKVVRLAMFRDPLKDLIHQIKYHRRWPLAEFLADRLMEQESVKGLLTYTHCLVPVPLHRVRQVGRGYNQSEVVARRLARRCKLKLARPAVRLRHTETQTHLHSRAQRLENLRDAFGLIRPKSIRDRHVVIVDDVMTTGATLQSFARVLRQARPASLCALILGVADPHGRDFQMI